MFCGPGLIFGCTEGVPFSYFAPRNRFRRYRGRRVPFSFFARLDSFSAVPRASCPFSMFLAPGHIFGGTEGVGSVFILCAPGLIFDGTGGVGYRLLVLCPPTHFRRYRGRRVRFHYMRPRTHFRRYGGHRVSFSAYEGGMRASCFHVLHPGIIFDGTENVRSHFLVLSARTHFRQFRGRRDLISCFARLDSFLTVPRASGPVFILCALGLVFGGTGGVGFRFLVLCPRIRFRRYRWRRVPFSCFALPDSFSAVPRASGLVFAFCAPRLVFGGTGGPGSHFLVLRARTRIRRYRGCKILFSCFALPDLFSAVPGASGPVFLFCAPEII
jgi:hypothetical protein